MGECMANATSLSKLRLVKLFTYRQQWDAEITLHILCTHKAVGSSRVVAKQWVLQGTRGRHLCIYGIKAALRTCLRQPDKILLETLFQPSLIHNRIATYLADTVGIAAGLVYAQLALLYVIHKGQHGRFALPTRLCASRGDTIRSYMEHWAPQETHTATPPPSHPSESPEHSGLTIPLSRWLGNGQAKSARITWSMLPSSGKMHRSPGVLPSHLIPTLSSCSVH
eukprot:scaffold2691_cov417-Prasinococcus_capsulatus_cf.AAC.21